MKKIILISLVLAALCGCRTENTKPAEDVVGADSLATATQPAGQAEQVAGQSPAPSAASTPKPPQPSAEPTKSAQPSETPEPAQNPERSEKTVSISIIGIGENSEILAPAVVEFEQGQTAFDILLKITREKGIHLEFTGRKSTVYIKGIGNLYEFAKGGESGWVYSVNGTFPSKSCGTYTVEKGDIIEFKYTTNVGEFNM